MALDDKMTNKPAKIFKAGVADDVKFGENVTIGDTCNLYGCEIGDNCLIAHYVEVQRGAKIGNNTRIQSHAFVCDKVTIGNDCFIGHHVCFTNDTFSVLGRPAYKELEHWKSTNIGNRVTIGSGAVLLPVNICDNVIIGAGAVVTKNIDRPGIYAGNPARYFRPVYEEYRKKIEEDKR